MDLHYKQEVTVGALVILGVALFVGGTMWLSGRSFAPGTPAVRVVFADAGTLKRGTPVKVSGVQLGSVDRINYLAYGKVEVGLSLDPRVAPRRDASAVLGTVGLVADAVIHFNPGSAADPLPPDSVIQGTMERGIMAMGSELGGQAKEVLTGLNQVQYKELSDNLNRTLTTFQRLANTYGDTKSGPAAELTTTMKSLQRVSARFDSVLEAAKLDRTLHTADSMMANLTRLSTDAQATARQLDQMLAKVNRGEGTLGRFAADTAFYDNAQRLMKSLQEFVDDLKKHPGKLGITVKMF
jgi:phospholipid/cholesterol/gamma-HCH transport system substrate-binding protein